jgi:hypothetical protein
MAWCASMVSRRITSLFVLSITLLCASCFAPSYGDGDLQCAVGATPCPDGYYCAATNRCWRNGHKPPRPPAPTDTSTAAAVGVKNASGVSHGLALSVGEPLVGGGSAPGSHSIQLGVIAGTASK